ncbi:hypothetical protein [Mediterraneibacter agrestimuris]|uniref:hypothetical protein n=1 Tax=Mediterraneibacter agrestimuris TaxID=2941333 RepID=UPI00203AD0C2|nr:hypothetical protein [Mediterraneibacter agrestimuris]
MSRTVRKQLLSMADTLAEANRAMKKYFLKTQVDEEAVVTLLSDCQDAAVALGTRIEELCGEETASVKELEDYCESLYQMALNIGNPSRRKELLKVLMGHVKQVRYWVGTDVPDRLEVVFLPYKASMWDSFESIYLAAKADADCDVYCVPIPYYDLNPDQSMGQLHYEITEYPDNIEMTDWRSYDIENQNPDVVYIHNPYDNYNRVTSVHPRYYSGNLKKYVGTLVYIPYNVTGGSLGKMHRRLPACFNVDYIIAQNERQKILYAQEISYKVKALGSPKFDKVINQVITDEMIPEEWKPKLRNTVLFLNTGIEGLLKHNEKSLLKIQYILKIAEEENVTLLWRPHPLLEATIQSMRPELWNLYLETIDKFHRYQNGILDRTGNVELAIGLSDAYIGEDTSSISHMSGVLGKPLFFIRQGILNELKDIENIKFNCCIADAADQNIIWASMASRNGLLKLTRNGVIQEIYIIPDEKDRSNLYSDILINDNKLYLVPRNAKEIAIFDIADKEFTKITLSNPEKKEKFSKGYLYENKIYFIPRMYEKMAVLHCDKKTLYYNGSLVDELKEITGIPNVLATANGSRLIGASIYIAAPNKPYVLEYNIKSNKNIIHKIHGAFSGFCCLENVSGKLVLGCMNRCELFVWDPFSEEASVIMDFPKEWKMDEKLCFWDILEKDGDAYIFPRTSPMILKLTLNNLTLAPLENAFPFSVEKRKNAFFNHPNHFLMVKKLIDGSIVVQDANRHGLSEFYTDGTFKWTKVSLNEEEELQIFGKMFSKLGENLPWGIYETRYYSVRRFISYVRQNLHDKERQKEAFSDAAVNLDGTAGEKIHEYIMRRL